MTEVKPGSPGVVEEDPESAPGTADAQIEGDRFVDGIGRAREAVSVGVPVDEGCSATIKVAGFVAQPEDLLVVRKGLSQGEPRSGKLYRIEIVSDDPTPLRIRHGQRQPLPD